MKRGTPFQIVGFLFLGFATLTIYQSEFTVGHSGGLVITRAHDPEAFWRNIIMQIVVGCAAIHFGHRLGRPQQIARFDDSYDPAQQAEPLERRPQLPNYDPDFCGKVLKAAACVCAGLIIAELLVLLLVHPSVDRCAGWNFHPRQSSGGTPFWFLAGMFTVLPALWLCIVALCWNSYFARKMYDALASGPPERLLINGNSLMLMVTVGWCLFCAIPLFLMLEQCTPLYHYLHTFHF